MAVRSAALIAVLAVIASLASCAAFTTNLEVHEPDLAHSIRRVIVCPGDIDEGILSVCPWPASHARQIMAKTLAEQVERETHWSATVDSGRACHPTSGGAVDAILCCDVKGYARNASSTRTEKEFNIFGLVGLGEPFEEVEVTERWNELRVTVVWLKLVDAATAQPIAEWRRTSNSSNLIVAKLPIHEAKFRSLTCDSMAAGVRALVGACGQARAAHD